MNKAETAEEIKVMQGYLNGKQIETRHRGSWVIIKDPPWNWQYETYRIKTIEPKQGEYYSNNGGNTTFRYIGIDMGRHLFAEYRKERFVQYISFRDLEGLKEIKI